MTTTAARAPSLAALVLITGVGPLATDTYLPALPEVQDDLGTTASVSQLTITAFLIGMAFGQLLFGPISDGRGRRGMLFAGACAFTVTSALCALAPTGPALVVLRLLEGLVGGCGTAVGRAVVSDFYVGTAAAARYGTLTAMTLLGPVLAPAIGGAILTFSNWRAVFVFLTAIGLLQILAVHRGVPETLPPEVRHPGGVRQSVRRMQELVHDSAFRRPVIVQCLATAGFFVYIGGSSFVVQGQLGFSEREYTLLFACNAAGMAVASFTFAPVVRRRGARLLRDAGLSVSFVAVCVLLVVALFALPGPPAVPLVWVVLAFAVAGNGWCIPGTTAIAQAAGRRYGGTASALQGGLVFTVGALATPLTGVTGHQTVLVMALLMSGLYLCAVVARLLGRDRQSSPAIVTPP